MRARGNLPSIPWTERERAEFKRRFAAIEALGAEIPAASSAADPQMLEGVVLRRVNDTTLRILMRGSDGIVRSAVITLS